MSFSLAVQIRCTIHPESGQIVSHLVFFVMRAQIEKCSQVFPWFPQNRFKSCPFYLSIKKSAASSRIHSYFIRSCCSPGYFAPCPLGKLCQELKFVYLKLENARTLSSANLCLRLPRTLSSANPVFRSSGHSAKCEFCC